MTDRNAFPLLPVLAVLVAGLGYANYRLMNLDVDVSAIAVPASEGGKSPQPKELSLVPPLRTAADYPETTTRPVFFADRKIPERPKPKPAPVAEVKEAPPPPLAPPPEPLQLVGIMGDGAGKRALVRTTMDQQGTWLSVGDEFRGWQLRDILTDNAIVEARGHRSELRLYAFGGAKSIKR
jgi:hypothetical protein